MTRPFFIRERVSDVGLFDQLTDIALAKLKERFAQPGSPPVDVQDLVSRFTMDITTEFVSLPLPRHTSSIATRS
jgi:hypothetical protein